jgi:hypothetical protein
MSRANPKPSTVDPGIVGLKNLIDRIGPWLLDLGNWIFGAIIAFNLLILGALLTVGPVDPGVIIASTAVALSLPLAAGGFFLVRLTTDMRNADLEPIATQAFQEAGFAVDQTQLTQIFRKSRESKRTRIVLAYSYGLLAFTVLVTLIGITAALWHMQWWIGIVFAAAAVASVGIVVAAIAQFGSDAAWRRPAGAVEPAKTAMSKSDRGRP